MIKEDRNCHISQSSKKLLVIYRKSTETPFGVSPVGLRWICGVKQTICVEVTVTDIKMYFIFVFYQRLFIQKFTVYTTIKIKCLSDSDKYTGDNKATIFNNLTSLFNQKVSWNLLIRQLSKWNLSIFNKWTLMEKRKLKWQWQILKGHLFLFSISICWFRK